MRAFLLIASAFLWLLAVAQAQSAEPGSRIAAQRACRSGESWSMDGTVGTTFRKGFESSLSGSIAPPRAFSEGLALRRLAQSPQARALGEYWVSRALLQAGLAHIADSGFAVIAGRAPSPDTEGVQLGALQCLLEIHRRHPSIQLPSAVAARLERYSDMAYTEAQRETVWEAAGLVLRAQLADQNADEESSPAEERAVERTLRLLAGSGPHEAIARALWRSSQENYAEAAAEAERFLNYPSLPEVLRPLQDDAHILMARALYSNGKFERAIAHLKQVKKQSNELAESLSELSWAYLLAERYGEAIGTAMNLQAGGLRHTFTPEAPMVMAMALNEICQYPESVRAISSFRHGYEKPYAWLTRWKREGAQAALYPLAVEFVRKTGDTPDKVASEWVRSPLFLASQDEINLIYDEAERAATLGRAGAVAQRQLGADILKRARSLGPRIQAARAKLKPGQDLPARIREDIAGIKEDLLHYHRLRRGAPAWRAILANHQRRAPELESSLVSRINADLRSRSLQMLTQLDEIAENVQLIEVEIYNGASQDIIWQNAHPDYQAVAQKIKSDRAVASHEKVWDWGHSAVSPEDGGEIWEDELGSFKATLYDNCSSKDRYLALKSRKGGSI